MKKLPPDEPLVRFAFFSNEFSESHGTLKPKAFEPTQKGDLSTFRIRGLDDMGIWRIARDIVDAPPNRVAKARGVVTIEVVEALRLHAIPDDSKPRHVGIVNWPAEKNDRMKIQQALASKSYSFMKRPSTIL